MQGARALALAQADGEQSRGRHSVALLASLSQQVVGCGRGRAPALEHVPALAPPPGALPCRPAALGVRSCG